MSTFIQEAWLGRIALWKVFLFGTVVGGLLPWLLAIVIPAPTLWEKAIEAVIAAAYGVSVCVALWRCAYNVKAKAWGHLARLYVIAAIVVVAANFLR